MKHLPNLLIVDDTVENLFFIEAAIKKLEVNLIKAFSGYEALKKTKGIELALAIIDVRMPVMNGYELAIKLNEERSGEKVPVIFLTADHIKETEVFKGYDSGAVDYIFKPVEINILRSKINVFIDLFDQKQRIIRDAGLLKKSADELNSLNFALKKSEEKYRSYIDNAPDGVFVSDETGRYIEVNEAACQITGYSTRELMKMSFSDLLPVESLEEGRDSFNKAIKSGISKIDLLYRQKDGTKRFWALEAVKISNERILFFAKDITQRKVMEEAIRTYQIELEIQNSELVTQNGEIQLAREQAEFLSQKYSKLYDFAPSGYFTLNAEHAIQEVNLNGALILGKEPSSLIGSNFRFYVSKNTLSVYNAFFQNIFISKTKEVCEVILMTDSNHSKYFHLEGIVNMKGTQCLLNVVDITERKLAEELLKISEEKYRTMLNASPDGILLIDLKGIITEISEIGLELFGAETRDDLMDKKISTFIPTEESYLLKEIFEKTMSEGLVQNLEMKIKKKDQSIFVAETSVTLIQGSDGSPLSFMVIIRDISQRKKTETKQIHADRMANLGEMASGIAHEINQPLNIISMVMDKVLFETTKTETIDIEFIKNKSDKIFENITRIRNIIDHIRAFSRTHDDYVLTTFDVNLSIENAASMLSEQFKYLGISLKLQLNKKVPQILGNTYKFEQVIINLLINAKDAVIEKKNKMPEYFEMIIGIRSYLENQFLIIEVTDNGIGIDDVDINNIMLPFYTSKEEGKGTGIGLSICYQILKEMGGTIDITSENFSGTKIKLALKSQMNN